MWLARVDAWVTASVLVIVMLLAAELGLRAGMRTANRPGATSTRIDDATAALFGLLLGFTFGSAASRYDRRLWLMVGEATAIGDFAGVASVLAEPERSELKAQLRQYIDVRIETSFAGRDAAKDAALVARAREMHQTMTAITARAIESKNTPSVHPTLVTVLNATTTTFENRRAALNDHVPVTILVMLLVSSILGAMSLGRVQGVNRTRQSVPTVIFIGLVGLTIFTILDLEQPRWGVVGVPVTALESVRSSLQP